MASSPGDRGPITQLREERPLHDGASLPSIDDVLADPGASTWLKAALRRAITRDPIDALNDALVLTALLEERLRLVFDIDVDPPNEEEN